MIDYSYFKDLSPRQQLNDLIHKHAQENGGNYGDSWRELERRWKEKHGSSLSWKRWKHNHDNKTNLTLPAYLDSTAQTEKAIFIGHEMTNGKLKN